MICTEGQPFGENYSPLYKAGGLAGHTGQDWTCGFGSPIYTRYTGLVYKAYSAANTPNSDGYTEVGIIVDDGKECFEWLVGHLDPAVKEGDWVTAGQLIGTEANHGPVFSGNVQITVAQQKAGNQSGHHRHYQKRPLWSAMYAQGKSLTGRNGYPYLTETGYYNVWNSGNGFNGCVDPTKPVFGSLLCLGMSGYEVYVLQRILKKYGLFDYDCTGYFGPITTTALMRYQNAKSLSMVGFAGPQTRAALSQELQALPDLSGE